MKERLKFLYTFLDHGGRTNGHGGSPLPATHFIFGSLPGLKYLLDESENRNTGHK
jgi:hypothetical protein